MSDTVIKVENISKRYRLGLKEKQAETLAGQIGNMIKSPWQNLKRLREMSKFGVEDDSVFWALKDINFEVKEGEVLGIIGKNGAGKSTLLKILSQITDPTSGKIEIHGRVASLLEVGTGFHPELSGRENIYMNGTILGMTRREIDTKLDEIIDFSGVEKFIDTPVKFYSSGMKVRLGFSVAAHLEPEILIIDEVLAVGDFEFQKKCLGKMENVAGQGRTVLFVSHQMDAIRNLCPNSLLLENGRVLLIENTSKVLEKYFNFNDYILKNESEYENNLHIKHVKFYEEELLNSKIKLEISFESKNIINFPVAGFVVYNQFGTPVFGSNPRFHKKGYTAIPSRKGTITAESEKLRIHSGIYRISIWFGDFNHDLEKLEDNIIFDFQSKSNYSNIPSSLSIGSMDNYTHWKFTS
jgi:ABC-type polysaccharide/polyol phosphate transport system ATPase subunit